MDLWPVETFEPKGATREIVEDLERAVNEIEQHRPLPEHIGRKLSEDLLYDRIYSSAVTEGNRLSRRETIAVLTAGLIEAGSRKDVAEIRNLGQAILRLDKFLHDKVPVSEGFIREVQRIVLDGIEQREAGAYRREQVAIAGSKTVPPPPGDVPDLINTVAQLINQSFETSHPVVLAGWAHWAITRIHPFRDGNGRVARLVQDYILLRRNYIPAPLFPEDRQEQYYDALEAADLGQSAPFVELLAKNMLRVADRYLSAIREDTVKIDWLEKITKTAAENIRQTEHRRFIRWERRLTALKAEFEEISKELVAKVPGLHVNWLDYGGINYEKYRSLRDHVPTERSWAFGLLFRRENTRLRFVFWIGFHRERPSDRAQDITDEPVLLVSMEEQKRGSKDGTPASVGTTDKVFYRTLDELSETMISLREVIMRDGTLARRRYNPTAQSDEWDFAVSPGQVARDFFTEVLRKLLLV
jgi:Fic family protein